jgi:hypothetical protein
VVDRRRGRPLPAVEDRGLHERQASRAENLGGARQVADGNEDTVTRCAQPLGDGRELKQMSVVRAQLPGKEDTAHR